LRSDYSASFASSGYLRELLHGLCRSGDERCVAHIYAPRQHKFECVLPFTDGSKEIVFLYRLVPGLATRSFGVWVGKLAGIPQPVLDRAQQKGDEMRLQQIARLVEKMLDKSNSLESDSLQPREIVELLIKAKPVLSGRR
jgi:hypothetical protein